MILNKIRKDMIFMLRKFRNLFKNICTLGALLAFVSAAIMLIQNLGSDQLMVNGEMINQYRFTYSSISTTAIISFVLLVAARRFRR